MNTSFKHLIIWLIAYCISAVLVSCLNDPSSTSFEKSRIGYMKLPYDTPLDAVKWTNGYWHDYMVRLRNIYIPGTLDGSFLDLKNGSTFRNFYRAAGMEEGGALGRTWSDGDCCFILDAVARLYAYQPDDYLKSKLDYWIDIIGKTQREDGLFDTWSILKRFDDKSGEFWGKFHRFGPGSTFQGMTNYNLAHLCVAATTHYKVTGDSSFLKIAYRASDYQLREGEKRALREGRDYGVTGHTSFAFGKRYMLTGDNRFLKPIVNGYSQPGSVFGPPLREAQEIYGHNTATSEYLSGAVMLYKYTGDTTVIVALQRLADNLLDGKVFITGAIGPIQHGERPEITINGKTYPSSGLGEAVGKSFDLPNDISYCESCGQNLYVERLFELFRLTGEQRYMDAVERLLYNAAPGCVDIARPNYFYCNPQEQGPDSRRRGECEPDLNQDGNYSWKRAYTKKCACCPPKVLRGLAMVNEIAYSVNDEGLWVNLYGSNTFTAELPAGGSVIVSQESDYPWDGKVKITMDEVKSIKSFSVLLRIPGWLTTPVSISVNGEVMEKGVAADSYYKADRKWKSGDIIEMDFPMPVRYMAADPRIKDDVGKIAVMRGPVVYCLEDEDIPKGAGFTTLCMSGETELKPKRVMELGGVVKLYGTFCQGDKKSLLTEPVKEFSDSDGPYKEISWEEIKQISTEGNPVEISLIPYYARLNREGRYFRVWIPVNK